MGFNHETDQGYSWVILVATTFGFLFEFMPSPGIFYMSFLEIYANGKHITHNKY